MSTCICVCERLLENRQTAAQPTANALLMWMDECVDGCVYGDRAVVAVVVVVVDHSCACVENVCARARNVEYASSLSSSTRHACSKTIRIPITHTRTSTNSQMMCVRVSLWHLAFEPPHCIVLRVRAVWFGSGSVFGARKPRASLRQILHTHTHML